MFVRQCLCLRDWQKKMNLSHIHLDPSHIMLWLRVTARTSAILLACAFVSRGLRQIWRSPLILSLEANRHRFTLLFGLSHTLHLVGIVALATLLPDQVFAKKNIPGLVLGAIGYALIYYLAWMAFANRKNPELPDGKTQTFGMYVLWAVFTIAFTAGVWRNAPIYTSLALVMWLAFVVRLWAGRVRVRSTAARD